MTVHRLHRFTLDEATLDSGLVIAAAGSGLPRRVHPRYLDLVLSMSPEAAWGLGETGGTQDSLLDATGNGHHLTPVYGQSVYAGSPSDALGNAPCAPALAGVDKGIRFGACTGNNNYHRAIRSVAGDLPLVPGVGYPWSFAGWVRFNGGYRGNVAWVCGARDATGFGFELSLLSGVVRFFISDGAGKQRTYDAVGRTGSQLPLYGGDFHDYLWHHFVCTFDGVYTSGGVKVYWDGALVATSGEANTLDGTRDCRSSSAQFQINAGGYSIRSSDLGVDYDDCAVWSRVLSATEVAKLYATDPANIPAVKKARWTRSFTADATLRDVLPPGPLGDVLMAAGTFTRSKVYVSRDGTNRTRVYPGVDADYSISNGDTLYLDVEVSDCAFPPYLGGASGEGPAIIYEEADPGLPPPPSTPPAGEARRSNALQPPAAGDAGSNRLRPPSGGAAASA